MVRNIDLCADFLCGDKRLFHIHIAEPAVNAYKGDVGLIFNDTEQLTGFDPYEKNIIHPVFYFR